MGYLALYRKYRPSEFDQVVGQEYIIKIIRNSILHNKFSHAYLFSGPRGTGKTTMAKLIAKMINCESLFENNSCNKCESCISVNEKNHPDIIEIDAASNNGVDEIREIREKVNLMPALSKYKVYIIDEVHMLSTGAFNALLKTLEEPPEHVVFILATTEFYKVPATITSRCQCFDFERISQKNITKKLNDIVMMEKIKVETEVLNLIAKYSDGGMRDAINTLDKLICCSDVITLKDFYDLRGLSSPDEVEYFIKKLEVNDIDDVLNKLSELIEKGKNVILLAEELVVFIKDNLIIAVKKSNDDGYIEKLCEALDLLNQTIINMKKSGYPIILFEICIIKLARILNKNINEKIISREIIDLEKCNENTKIEEFSIKNKEKEENNDIIEDVLEEPELINQKLVNNKEIRINNAFALADKDLLKTLNNSWKDFSDYLNDNNFSKIVSYFVDGTLRVTGEKDIVISLKYKSMLKNAENNLEKIEELFSIVNKKAYKIVFILDEEWEILKKDYINNKKTGIIYKYIEEKEEEKKKEVVEEQIKNSDIINKAINLIGDDLVEIK